MLHKNIQSFTNITNMNYRYNVCQAEVFWKGIFLKGYSFSISNYERISIEQYPRPAKFPSWKLGLIKTMMTLFVIHITQKHSNITNMNYVMQKYFERVYFWKGSIFLSPTSKEKGGGGEGRKEEQKENMRRSQDWYSNGKLKQHWETFENIKK